MKNPKNGLFSNFEDSKLSDKAFTSVMGGATKQSEDSVDQCTSMPGSGDAADCIAPNSPTGFPSDAYVTKPPYVDTPN